MVLNQSFVYLPNVLQGKGLSSLTFKFESGIPGTVDSTSVIIYQTTIELSDH